MAEEPETKSRFSRYRRAQKARCVEHYSGGYNCCCCCGEKDMDNLEINHLYGDGNEHRIELFGRNTASTRMYNYLIREHFPPGYDVRCKRCNLNYQPPTGQLGLKFDVF